MLKVIKSAVAVAVVTLGLSAGSAQATFISGLVSLSDGFNPGALGTTTSVVSGLNSINQGNTGFAGGCTGDFSTAGVCTSNTFTASIINLLAPPDNNLYTNGIFTFSALTYTNIVRHALSCTSGQCTDSLAFDITGIVDDGAGGFDPTAFTGVWTGNGSCLQATSGGAVCNGQSSGSWSISLVALGQNTVPEPATLGLLGIALAGLGVFGRRKQS